MLKSTPMNVNYREMLAQKVNMKKRLMPTTYSEAAVEAIRFTLADTPLFIAAFVHQISEESAHQPLMEGKRSIYDTLLHLLHFEALHHTLSYPTKLLSQPHVYPIHPERDISKLKLYANFSLSELVQAFQYERRKYLNFLNSLSHEDWQRTMIESGKARKETLYLAARRTALHDYAHIQIISFQTGFTRE